jgi:flagellar hook assembly protein FlgD
LSAGEVEVAIYSPQGHLVRKLYDGLVEAGRHELLWDGRNENGRAVGSGQYFYRMKGPSWAEAGKLFVVK